MTRFGMGYDVHRLVAGRRLILGGVDIPHSTDPAYEGISSMVLLEQVARLLDEKGWKVGNLDATIVAQQPKLAPFIATMDANIARVLGILPGQVNVKATTEEHLGFTGTEQGIAAYAVAGLEAK